jgi:hypothetical protein
LVAIDGSFGRNKAGHRLAVSRNDYLLTVLDQVEQLAELVFRLEGTELGHPQLRKSTSLS